MKFSTYLSLMTLGASTVAAAPLFRDNIVAERRQHVPAPVARRQEASAAATEASATAAATAVATAAPEASAASTSQAPFEYSTITNTAGFSFSGKTYSLSSSVSTSATTETQLPQSTESASSASNGSSNVNRNMNDVSNLGSNNFNFNNNGLNNNFNSFDFGNSAVITVREVQTITQFVAVEVPVFLGVQVNNNFRESLFSNQFANSFQSRFSNWDANVINQLGFLLAQQYEFLSRSSNNGFSSFNNDNFNSFVNKFVDQFNVFQSFDISQVQQLISLLQGLNVNQLSSFFGRSDLLFSQDLFNQFNINNNFNSFVSDLPQLLVVIESGAFNNDGIFNNLSNLNSNSLNFLQVV